jgi:hypothetical protein
MLIDHQRKFVFFHIPKTAGQAVVTALGEKHEPSHHNLGDVDEYRDYFRFCFVRDPIERFVSAYRYSIDMVGRGHTNAGHPIRLLIAEQGLDKSLESFVEAIRELEPHELFANLHFRPQIRWVQPARPQFIGRHETLTQDIGYVARVLGIEVPNTPPTVNRSRSRVDAQMSVDSEAYLRKLYVNDYRLLGYNRKWA